jgi:hypothetical protein
MRPPSQLIAWDALKHAAGGPCFLLKLLQHSID